MIGEWLKAASDPSDLWQSVEVILNQYSDDPDECEEFIILDYEDFGVINIQQYENLDRVSKLAQALIEHGDAFGVYYEHIADDQDDINAVIDSFTDAFYGVFDNMDSFVEDYIDNMTCTEIINTYFLYGKLFDYLDKEKIQYALEISGDYEFHKHENSVYVFQN